MEKSEIDELRAKVIASMASSSSAKARSSDNSREEGELSDDEPPELPNCTVAGDEPMAPVVDPVTSSIKVTQSPPETSKVTPLSKPNVGNLQHPKTKMPNSIKYFKNRQVAFRYPSSNQARHWSRKESTNNLVISFSDDESASDSQEGGPAPSMGRHAVTKGDLCKSSELQKEVPELISSNKTQMPKDSLSSISSIAKVQDYGVGHSNVSFTDREPNHQKNKVTATYSAIQDDKHYSVTSVNRSPTPYELETLRHQISVKENQMKVQNKPICEISSRVRKLSAVCKSDSHIGEAETRITNIEGKESHGAVRLVPGEQPLKRLKVGEGRAGICSRQMSKVGSEEQGTMNHSCRTEGRPDNQSTESDRSLSISSEDLAPAEQTIKCLKVAEGSTSIYSRQRAKRVNEEKGNVNDTCRMEPRSDNQGPDSDGPLSISSEDTGATNNISLVVDDEIMPPIAGQLQVPCTLGNSVGYPADRKVMAADFSTDMKKTVAVACTTSDCGPLYQNDQHFSRYMRNMNTSDALPSKELFQSELEGHQQTKANSDNVISVETYTINDGKSDIHNPDSILPIGEANPCNTSLLNHANQMDIMEAERMGLESLIRLEDLHDKELEKAQEHRRRCEHEERKALKLYRAAQRALVEANIRCSMLYRKRELFSAQLRTLTYEGSNSILPSSWQDQKRDLFESLSSLPNARCDFLSPIGNQRQPQQHTSEQLDCKTNAKYYCDPQKASYLRFHENDYVSEECFHNDAGTMGPKDGYALSGGGSSPVDGSCAMRLGSHTAGGNLEEKPPNANFELERVPPVEKDPDYELLEASLRSKLVARLGMRTSSKERDGRNTDSRVDNGVGCNIPIEKPCNLVDCHLQEGQKQETEGAEELGCHNVQANSDVPLVTLPTSVPRIVSRHLVSLAGVGTDTCIKQTKEIVACSPAQEVKVADHGNCTKEYATRKYKSNGNLHMPNSAIDPFWPLCMFELRGKCNDEECPWQHVNRIVKRKLKQIKNSTECSDKLGLNLYQQLLSIPTYKIGSCIVKADSHLSCSILSGSACQYWQRGFCTSFPLPFSTKRILSSDTTCLQAGNNRIADNGWLKSPSLYLQGPNMEAKNFMESPDIEQPLEMALDIFLGKICKPDRKKALSLLSRAIETEPRSVVLWVAYLHIYYEKGSCVGVDDMFFHAVQHNEGSYDLWLMYINSRMQITDHYDAYNYALTAFYQRAESGVEEISYISACILDIFLQMINVLSMSGNVDKVATMISELLPSSNCEGSGDTLMSDIESCLVMDDRCIFWVCCIYVIIYRRLPEAVEERIGFEKGFTFGIEWPAIQLATDKKDTALKLFRFAVNKISLCTDIKDTQDLTLLRSLNFLMVSHIKCVAAVDGLHSCAHLLQKYLGEYPASQEIFLLSARLNEECMGSISLRGFEEVVSCWPKEIPGVQFFWNQYAECALANRKTDHVENLMSHWFQCFCQVQDEEVFSGTGGEDDSISSIQSLELTFKDDVQPPVQDNIFRFLNLFIYRMLQKDYRGAHVAVNKALSVATTDYFEHCVKEHACFIISRCRYTFVNSSSFLTTDMLKNYLDDPRASRTLMPLSRRYYQTIKRPRVRELIDSILGPAPVDSSLLNSILEACYGPSLLPEKFGKTQDFVDYVESLSEIAPANYQLALSVCKSMGRYFCSDNIASKASLFWAASLLVDAIFQFIPAAPERIWLEAVTYLQELGSSSISRRFLQRALSVFPFSVQLWHSCYRLAEMTGDASEIEEAVRERGLDVNLVMADS